MPDDQRSAGQIHSHTATMVPGKLFALQNTMVLDGRVAAYPPSARGFAPVNCYILREDDGALMLDLGFAAHRQPILDQLDHIIGRDRPLTLFPLRINEFMSVSNGAAIAMGFNVESCLSHLHDVAYWIDLESMTTAEIVAVERRLQTRAISGNDTIYIGRGDNRPVTLYQSPIRLIATRWCYDHVTKTLFTSDMFSNHWDDRPDADWVIDETNDTATVDHIIRFLLHTRYWWLDGANTDGMRRSIAALFDKVDVETIAPGYGKILRGRSVCARHIGLLDEALRLLDRRHRPARYISRDEAA